MRIGGAVRGRASLWSFFTQRAQNSLRDSIGNRPGKVMEGRLPRTMTESMQAAVPGRMGRFIAERSFDGFPWSTTMARGPRPLCVRTSTPPATTNSSTVCIYIRPGQCRTAGVTSAGDNSRCSWVSVANWKFDGRFQASA